MRKLIPLAAMFWGGLMVLGTEVVSGQDYPDRPIRMVTAEAGGSTDFTARLIAQGLSARLGQLIVVDNRGGGGGIIAGETVNKAPPNGYTVLVAGSSFWIGTLFAKTPYDPVIDFSPITVANRQPNVVVVHPSLPATSIKELIAVAKAKPGMLHYGSGNTGSSSHLGAELLKAMAGVDIVRIPYKGTGPALNALISGEVQVLFTTAGAVAPHVKPGRLRALAVTSAEPSALAPGLPTVASSGLPGYQSVAMYGIFAPPKTPATLIKRLNQESVRFLHSAEARERFFNFGSETVGSSPEELVATMKSEMDRLGKVVREAGIRAD